MGITYTIDPYGLPVRLNRIHFGDARISKGRGEKSSGAIRAAFGCR